MKQNHYHMSKKYIIARKHIEKPLYFFCVSENTKTATFLKLEDDQFSSVEKADWMDARKNESFLKILPMEELNGLKRKVYNHLDATPIEPKKVIIPVINKRPQTVRPHVKMWVHATVRTGT